MRKYKMALTILKYDTKIILGDCNAKIGNEAIYKSVTEGKSKHECTNQNGKCIIEFARENSMQIMSTLITKIYR